MRFLVSEKAYETPIASGRLRYEKDELETGVLESWRLTKTEYGDRILRVDYDSRTLNGQSFLYHLMLDENDAPQRLVYRYLHDNGAELSGNLLFTEATMLNSRKIGEAHFSEEMALRPILFPSAIGAGFAARALITPRVRSAEVGVLDMHATDAHLLNLQTQTVTIRHQRTRNLKIVRVGRTTHRTTTLELAWGEQSYKLWLDLKHKWPLKVERKNGTIAHETQYIRFG
ncbi:MAG: hypothetical protein ACPG8W_10180 [Candidatus Promineifilaceae bacterium]